MLIILDEATGVDAQIWTQSEGLMTSGEIVKMVAIGNPTTRACEFFNCFSSAQWKKIYLSCFDSPNMIANGITDMGKLQDEIDKISTMQDEERLKYIASYKKPNQYLLTAQWVISKSYDWGIDHPLTESKILGKFPKEDDNVLVSFAAVEAAQRRELELESSSRFIGVDVARFGEDKTVFTELIGNKHISTISMVKRETTHIAGKLINMINTSSLKTIVMVDATGIGAGVVDVLQEARRENRLNPGTHVVELHFGQACEDEDDRKLYANAKAKMFHILGKDLANEIDLKEDAVYLEELPTIMYKFNSQGKIVVESKDDYKKITGRNSPDHADSLAIANYARHYGKRIGEFGNNREKNNYLTKSNKPNDTFKRLGNRIKPRSY